MQAIISTAKREGLTEFARELQARNVTIFSTSGTASALKAEGIDAESVSALTGFPEILDGRVKTLHPTIFAGILARRDSTPHTHDLQDQGIVPIDIVVVNLYRWNSFNSCSRQEFSGCNRTGAAARLRASDAGVEGAG